MRRRSFQLTWRVLVAPDHVARRVLAQRRQADVRMDPTLPRARAGQAPDRVVGSQGVICSNRVPPGRLDARDHDFRPRRRHGSRRRSARPGRLPANVVRADEPPRTKHVRGVCHAAAMAWFGAASECALRRGLAWRQRALSACARPPIEHGPARVIDRAIDQTARDPPDRRSLDDRSRSTSSPSDHDRPPRTGRVLFSRSRRLELRRRRSSGCPSGAGARSSGLASATR